MGALLQQGEESPFVAAVNEEGRSPFVLICEHASNTPRRRRWARWGCRRLESHGRHIAWDIGAEKVARLLSRLMDAPLLPEALSRLA